MKVLLAFVAFISRCRVPKPLLDWKPDYLQTNTRLELFHLDLGSITALKLVTPLLFKALHFTIVRPCFLLINNTAHDDDIRSLFRTPSSAAEKGKERWPSSIVTTFSSWGHQSHV